MAEFKNKRRSDDLNILFKLAMNSSIEYIHVLYKISSLFFIQSPI
jgi:hypothetical protein